MASTRDLKQSDNAASQAQNKERFETKKLCGDTILGPDGKLSSASAAAVLKRADAENLPAFPILGVQDSGQSAETAAMLAEQQKTGFQHWRPDRMPAAHQAAVLAKDYKVNPLQAPSLSTAGSRAALLAASKQERLTSSFDQTQRNIDSKASVDKSRRTGALNAASEAINHPSNGPSKGSHSLPGFPDATNSAINALKAANIADNSRREALDSTKPPTSKSFNTPSSGSVAMPSTLYSSHPLVGPELDEQKRQAGLRAAAVSMAQKMYFIQQQQETRSDSATDGHSHQAADKAVKRPQPLMTSDSSNTAASFDKLQETATRLAAEKLAKLHDEDAAYRSYYGTGMQGNTRSNLGNWRRAAGDSFESQSDAEKSLYIRQQMNQMTDNIALIDVKKRQQDRDFLIAAAKRNVQAKMSAQDQALFEATGKMTPAMRNDWESQAQLKAQAESDKRTANHGLISLGAGKFLSQLEIEAIAINKLQPTLDAIDTAAAEQRAHDEEMKQERMEREQLAADRAADDQERAALAKEEWKSFKEAEKKEEKIRKAEAKSRKQQRNRHSRLWEMLPQHTSSRQNPPESSVASGKSILSPKTARKQEPESPELENADSSCNPQVPAANPDVTAPRRDEEQATEHIDTGHYRSTVLQAGKQIPHATSDAQIQDAESNKIGMRPLADRIAPMTDASDVNLNASDTLLGANSDDAHPEREGAGVSAWLKTKFRRSRKISNELSPEKRRLNVVNPNSPAVPSVSEATITSSDINAERQANQSRSISPATRLKTLTYEDSSQEKAMPKSSSINPSISDEEARGRTPHRDTNIVPNTQEGAGSGLTGQDSTNTPSEGAQHGCMLITNSNQAVNSSQRTIPHAGEGGERHISSSTSAVSITRQSESPARDSRFVEAL